jgi:lipopolysaccharide export system permease protein
VFNRLFKKLDILIIKAFIGPFIATFFITTFVLVLQFMWLYIDDVVGKGIDTFTVLRLLLYVAATVVPLALPLAVLLSSIMTLGNLGETYELVAIKSAGISLLRFLRPLAVISFIITIIAFFFNNNVLPISNLKMQTLKYDIIVSKPAFDIKEGVFYDRIEGFVIKIGKKEKDDSTIRNVVIYEQNNNGQQDNMIVADSGTMVVTPDKQSLVFTLESGWRYQEKGERNVYAGTELIRMGFKRYKKVMDLSSFKMNQTNDSAFKGNFNMFTLPQLGHAIDSLKKVVQKNVDAINLISRRVYQFPHYLDTTGWAQVENKELNDPHLLKYSWARDSLTKLWTRDRKIIDSTQKARKAQAEAAQKAQAEAAHKAQELAKANAAKAKGHPTSSGPGHPAAATHAPATTATSKPASSAKPAAVTPAGPAAIPGPALTIGGAPVTKDPPGVRINDLIPDSERLNVVNRTIDAINQIKGETAVPYNFYSSQDHNLLQHEMAWHEKITLAVACMVMFLIGAPLGSIIRKGGIGLPLVFAVVFFVIFFLLNNFGKKLASSNVLTPANGLWLATYVLTPMGLFLVYKALHDSQLFNKEFYFRLTRKLRPFLASLTRSGREKAQEKAKASEEPKGGEKGGEKGEEKGEEKGGEEGGEKGGKKGKGGPAAAA